MKKRIFALVLAVMLCMPFAALAQEEDLTPGYSQGEAAVLKPGIRYYSQAGNQSLWYRFTAPDAGTCTIGITSLSLRCYSSRTNDDLTVPVMVSNRYGLSSAYTNVTIPNNNVFHPVYDQDGNMERIIFQADAGAEYYLWINTAAVCTPEDRVEGYFSLTLCTDKTHVLQENTVMTEPGCETPGLSGQVCQLCGEGVNLTELPALGHAYGAETVFVEGSCTVSGVIGHVCVNCGKEEAKEPIEAPGHVAGTPVEVRKPTCTEDGNAEYYCAVCGELISRETVPVLGHQPDVYMIAVPAGCETEGLRKQYCSICGELYQQEIIPATGHVPGAMVQVKGATCLENGYAEQRCTVCNKVVAVEELIATGHVAGEFVQARQQDVMQTGLLTSSCLLCGELMDAKELPAIGNFILRLDRPMRLYSIKGVDLPAVRLVDMELPDAIAEPQMNAYLDGKTLIVEESAKSKMANLAYVPFTVSVCVPANTCYVATYTFDMYADKRANNGNAELNTKLIDLGYADMPYEGTFDPAKLREDALIALNTGDHRTPATGRAVMKAVFNNNSNEPKVVDHYFGVFAGINFASTYEHRLLTELKVSAVLEDVTASLTEENLVQFINNLQ